MNVLIDHSHLEILVAHARGIDIIPNHLTEALKAADRAFPPMDCSEYLEAVAILPGDGFRFLRHGEVKAEGDQWRFRHPRSTWAPVEKIGEPFIDNGARLVRRRK